MTPDHYDKKIQPVEYMQCIMSEEAYKGFLWGNVMKYMSRWEEKDKVADLKKAQHYLEMMVRHVS